MTGPLWVESVAVVVVPDAAVLAADDPKLNESWGVEVVAVDAAGKLKETAEDVV